MRHNTEGSEFLHKEPCPSCGSKDNLGRYSDGHGFCFGCDYYEPGDGSEPTTGKRNNRMADMINGEYKELAKRGITLETCRKFGYTVGTFKGRPVQIAPYFDADGSMVAQKVRFPDKDFFLNGSLKKSLLFGANLWGGGKKLVITEGEIDAMSVSQAQGNKWPVVSIPNGASGAKKFLASQLEYLSKFDEIILMFDMDAPGIEAAADCAALFAPGVCKVASLPMKDPNELLQAGRAGDIVSAIWNAKPYRPDGIVTLVDLREEVLKPLVQGLPWFSDTLTKHTYGRRMGEIYALGAGTGIGKTDFLTQQIQYDIGTLNEKVSIFFLEQKPAETAKRLTGKFVGKRFHIPDTGWTEADLIEAWDNLAARGQLFLYDSFGATDWERIASTIRFLAHSEGVKLFYIDHLTALAAAEEDERIALEKIMAEMSSLTQELGIVIHLISHLATPEGTPHEEGGRVMIRHFKGSRSIGFWCHYMFGMERAQQHEDPRMRCITTFRILKDRYTGNATGEVIYLGYDRDTGMLFETALPTAENGHGFSDESSADLDDEIPF